MRHDKLNVHEVFLTVRVREGHETSTTAVAAASAVTSGRESGQNPSYRSRK
jgi:hypothetical protein